MIKSSSELIFTNCETSSRLSTRLTAFSGTVSFFARVFRISFASTRFEFCASLPPFKITAFPDFRANAEICMTTSGRDSKITRMTPIGQDTR